MHRLICAFVVHILQKQVLSWRSSSINHHNDGKNSHRQVWANSVDPDQTAHLSLHCHAVSTFWMHYSMVKLHYSIFRIPVITLILLGVWTFSYKLRFWTPYWTIPYSPYSVFLGLVSLVVGRSQTNHALLLPNNKCTNKIAYKYFKVYLCEYIEDIFDM